VNWDEFHFLSHVYTSSRGEITHVLQRAHTHLFAWLPMIPGNEIDQIVAARWAMFTLHCLTTWLIWRLARHWLSRASAIVPCFVYLSAIPVLIHGASFRFDSMLAPLSMAAIYLLVAKPRTAAREWAAATLLGSAFAISVKAVLIAPVVIGVLVFSPALAWPDPGHRLRHTGLSLIRTFAGAVAAATMLVGLHSLTIASGDAAPVASFARDVAGKTLFEDPWFPRLDFLIAYLKWQPLHWLLIALGGLLALMQRRFQLSCLLLSLLPIAFYRNAFPYYYVVMLAPASVLAGFAIEEMATLVRKYSRESLAAALVLVVWTGLLYQGLKHVDRLRYDDQYAQRLLVSAVHQIFPEPVSYIDRCGMISSFRKVNFFMSTWGIESYRNRGEPFMPSVIRQWQPAFVLENHQVLNPSYRYDNGLLPLDSDHIARFYPKYWGPIRVAGAAADLPHNQTITISVPFPALYRLASTDAVTVNGSRLEPGQIVFIPAGGAYITLAPGATAIDGHNRVTFFLAAARPPPNYEFPVVRLFSGL